MVDIPEDWEPRAKQQPTGLIAYGTSCRRPVLVLHRPRKKSQVKRLGIFVVEHQGVEPWHRSPGLSHFESLKLLDEAGSSRLSLAAEGIFATSKKARHTAICRQKSAAFCEMTLEKAFFTRGVSDCISGVVVLDVR